MGEVIDLRSKKRIQKTEGFEETTFPDAKINDKSRLRKERADNNNKVLKEYGIQGRDSAKDDPEVVAAKPEEEPSRDRELEARIERIRATIGRIKDQIGEMKRHDDN